MYEGQRVRALNIDISHHGGLRVDLGPELCIMELADQPTEFDRTKCARVVPMRCLVLGLGRTGTKSVCTALSILGFDHVYHMDSALNNPLDNDMWLRALDSKYGTNASSFGRQEWDQLLGHCQVSRAGAGRRILTDISMQAVTDYPAALFYRELIDTYPEAKVILTNRNVDSWYEYVSQIRPGSRPQIIETDADPDRPSAPSTGDIMTPVYTSLR